MDLAASRTDFSSAFAAAFLVILARKVIAIVMWKFNALIEIRLRTRKFSKSRICFFARKYSSILHLEKYNLETFMTSSLLRIVLFVTSIMGCSVMP